MNKIWYGVVDYGGKVRCVCGNLCRIVFCTRTHDRTGQKCLKQIAQNNKRYHFGSEDNATNVL